MGYIWGKLTAHGIFRKEIPGYKVSKLPFFKRIK